MSVACTLTVTFTFPPGTQRSDWQIVIPGTTEAGSTGVFSSSPTLPLPPPAVNPNLLTQVQITPQFSPDPTLAKSCSFNIAVAGTVFDAQNNKSVPVGGSAPGGPFGVVVPHA